MIRVLRINREQVTLDVVRARVRPSVQRPFKRLGSDYKWSYTKSFKAVSTSGLRRGVWQSGEVLSILKSMRPSLLIWVKSQVMLTSVGTGTKEVSWATESPYRMKKVEERSWRGWWEHKHPFSLVKLHNPLGHCHGKPKSHKRQNNSNRNPSLLWWPSLLWLNCRKRLIICKS